MGHRDVRGRSRAISNGLTIPEFAPTPTRCAATSRPARCGAADGAGGGRCPPCGPVRQQAPRAWWSPLVAPTAGHCFSVHAGGTRPSQSTVVVADLRDVQHWATATSGPHSLFAGRSTSLLIWARSRRTRPTTPAPAAPRTPAPTCPGTTPLAARLRAEQQAPKPPGYRPTRQRLCLRRRRAHERRWLQDLKRRIARPPAAGAEQWWRFDQQAGR